MKKLILHILFIFCSFPMLDAEKNVEELKKHVCTVLPSLQGWCSKEKAISFIDLVLEIKPKICVEIGVFGGSSLFTVASALKFLGQGLIIGIDPWDKMECIKHLDSPNGEADLEWWDRVNLAHIYKSYLNMLKIYELNEYTSTMKTTAEKAASEMGTISIDILHIDGNHSEIASTQDVTLYLPKVRSGGYIFMDDTLLETTQRATDLLLESCDFVKIIDNGNCILFKKR